MFDPERYRGRRVGVLGAGLSGRAAAALLAAKGFRVLLSDSRRNPLPAAILKRLPKAIQIETGGHGPRLFSCGFIVKSPGLKPDAPILRKMRSKRVPVVSELELALAFAKASEVIAISGTNGKTTTTLLAGAIFKLARGAGRVHVCGNIGQAVSDTALKTRAGGTLVLEVSSYQLEDSRGFHPNAACLLNVSPDHLDHHGSFKAYATAKARLFREFESTDCGVFNARDPVASNVAREVRGRKLFFGRKGTNAWVEGRRMVFSYGGAPPRAVRPPALLGEHNLDNAMAAGLLALSRGIPLAVVARAFREFRPVEHRLETVGSYRGIQAINDSKATNVDSTAAALRSVSAPRGGLLLILGGLDKGSPYAPLRPLLRSGTKAVLTIGQAAPKIERELAGSAPLFSCGELKTALSAAFALGEPGDVLLLSPACASFDQFRDFEDRGRRFKRLLKAYA
jgi:UDP-N-acetylmuramoylalanine--D-glutamate ligase